MNNCRNGIDLTNHHQGEMLIDMDKMDQDQ